jgi:hypothetical protein
MQTSTSIETYLNYLQEVIIGRLNAHFNTGKSFDPEKVRVPAAAPGSSPLSDFIRNNKLETAETVMMLAVLAPHINPVFFDDLIQQNIPGQGDFPQFGGIRGRNHRGFLPTAETILFILAGNNLEKRFSCEALFSDDHFFAKQNIIYLEQPNPGEPQYSGKLIMSPEHVELFTTGKTSHPRFTMDFPAEYISTELTKDDLILPATTLKQIFELENWIDHHNTLMNGWNMKRWIKPGYRALFHGPPGTGKTLTALIIGKKTNRDVFRIDLSMVVSKFIGETEKNLSQLFERAKNKDWILFFDEAFIRRFQSVVYFPLPSAAERLQLWTKTLPAGAGLELPAHEDLAAIAKKYEITGAGIVNVVQHCCLESLAENSGQISIAQIRNRIEREYQKEGKVV